MSFVAFDSSAVERGSAGPTSSYEHDVGAFLGGRLRLSAWGEFVVAGVGDEPGVTPGESGGSHGVDESGVLVREGSTGVAVDVEVDGNAPGVAGEGLAFVDASWSPAAGEGGGVDEVTEVLVGERGQRGGERHDRFAVSADWPEDRYVGGDDVRGGPGRVNLDVSALGIAEAELAVGLFDEDLRGDGIAMTELCRLGR